jgi:hypothetical protein
MWPLIARAYLGTAIFRWAHLIKALLNTGFLRGAHVLNNAKILWYIGRV